MSLLKNIQMAERKSSAADKHYFTLKQWAVRWQKSEDQTKKWLEIGCKNGLLKRRVFKIANAAGSRVATPHWADVNKLKS